MVYARTAYLTLGALLVLARHERFSEQSVLSTPERVRPYTVMRLEHYTPELVQNAKPIAPLPDMISETPADVKPIEPPAQPNVNSAPPEASAMVHLSDAPLMPEFTAPKEEGKWQPPKLMYGEILDSYKRFPDETGTYLRSLSSLDVIALFPASEDSLEDFIATLDIDYKDQSSKYSPNRIGQFLVPYGRSDMRKKAFEQLDQKQLEGVVDAMLNLSAENSIRINFIWDKCGNDPYDGLYRTIPKVRGGNSMIRRAYGEGALKIEILADLLEADESKARRYMKMHRGDIEIVLDDAPRLQKRMREELQMHYERLADWITVELDRQFHEEAKKVAMLDAKAFKVREALDN